MTTMKIKSDYQGGLNLKNRASLNPLLKWLWDLLSFFSVEEITVPGDFHSQMFELNKLLASDLSGLVNSILDFAINCATVDYSIITPSSTLTEKLNDWITQINSSLRGRVPVGLKALSKEYFRERWKGSSLILARTIWEDVDGLQLPTKIWFIDGENLEIKDGNAQTRIIGEEQYYLKLTPKKVASLPMDANELIFVQKPFESWSSLYPTPFLYQRGVYKNLKILELINKKGERIVGKALEYLMLMKKGTEQLALKGAPEFIYSEEDLKKVKDNFNDFMNDYKTTGGVPTHVTNFDTEFEHLIPDYTKAINGALYNPIEKRILAGLGMIDITDVAIATRRESILNPKAFITEVRQGIDDFKVLLRDIIETIIEKNDSSHRKYTNQQIDIHSGIVRAFLNDAVRDHLRSMYDRGILSKQTYAEVVGEDVYFDIEKQRRKNELDEGVEDLMYPPVIQNQENAPDIRNFPGVTPSVPRNKEKITEPPSVTKNKENVPESKKGPEAKNFKGVALEEIESYEDVEKDFNEAQSLIEIGTIVKRKNGYYVLSEKTGKSLGGPYATYKEALKRLRAIEWFKTHGTEDIKEND